MIVLSIIDTGLLFKLGIELNSQNPENPVSTSGACALNRDRVTVGRLEEEDGDVGDENTEIFPLVIHTRTCLTLSNLSQPSQI